MHGVVRTVTIIQYKTFCRNGLAYISPHGNRIKINNLFERHLYLNRKGMVVNMKVLYSALVFLGVISIIMWLSACNTEEVVLNTKIQDLDFTVISEELLPEELSTILEEKKQDVFKVTYVDDGYLYICVGYGEQNTGGYSIAVRALYLMDNGIYIDTNLLGPKAGVEMPEGISYPYIVVKLKYIDKNVIFD